MIFWVQGRAPKLCEMRNLAKNGGPRARRIDSPHENFVGLAPLKKKNHASANIVPENAWPMKLI